MLHRALTPAEQEAVNEAARIALATYEAALADPKVVLPTAMHLAFLTLRRALEGK